MVAHVILVSALGPNLSFFPFLGDFYSTWGLLGQGPGLGLGPGLDNSNFNTSLSKLLVLVTIPYRAWLLPIPINALSFLAPTEAQEIQMSVCPSLIHVFTLHVNV